MTDFAHKKRPGQAEHNLSGLRAFISVVTASLKRSNVIAADQPPCNHRRSGGVIACFFCSPGSSKVHMLQCFEGSVAGSYV